MVKKNTYYYVSLLKFQPDDMIVERERWLDQTPTGGRKTKQSNTHQLATGSDLGLLIALI